MTKVVKKFKGQVRISAAEKAMMDKSGLGFTRIFRMGLDTLKLSIQSEAPHSCVYLYNTGENRAPPAAPLLPPPDPLAQVCPCPACPIRAAFGTLPHACSCGKKENERSGPAAAALYDHESMQHQSGKVIYCPVGAHHKPGCSP